MIQQPVHMGQFISVLLSKVEAQRKYYLEK